MRPHEPRALERDRVVTRRGTVTPQMPAAESDPSCPHEIRRPFMRQCWDDVSFAHWRVPPELVAQILPVVLAPDCFNGSAWVSLVTFQMRSLRITHVPPIPTTHNFAEVNVRTYVNGPDGPGVWFCSLDAPSALPVLVARALYGLPCCLASIRSDQHAARRGWAITRRWPTRATGYLAVEPTDLPADDDLAVSLTARWRLYSGARRIRVARIEHEPWPLHQARVTGCDTGLVRAAGFPITTAPLAHWAPQVNVRAQAPQRVDRNYG